MTQKDFETECQIRANAYALELVDVWRMQSPDYDTLFEYLNENELDREYTVGGDGELRGWRVCVTCGGPAVYITSDGAIEYYHGTTHVTAWLPEGIIPELNDIISDDYTMLRG